MKEKTKEKPKDKKGSKHKVELVDLILLGMGLIFLTVGIRHYDFFGFNWKNILCIIFGLIFFYLSILKKRGKNETKTKR